MQDDNFTQKELNYISEVKRIGREKGDCKELQELSNLCWKEYNDKSISEKAYSRIYALCMDFAYPR